MRQLDSEGTNATLYAPWHSFHPEIDLGLTVALLTPSDKWQTFQVQSGLTWPMANKRPHAAQILDEFQVIDTADRLSSFVCLDYWHSDRIYGGKQLSLAAAVISFLYYFFNLMQMLLTAVFDPASIVYDTWCKVDKCRKCVEKEQFLPVKVQFKGASNAKRIYKKWIDPLLSWDIVALPRRPSYLARHLNLRQTLKKL